jgi:hypothetical protein
MVLDSRWARSPGPERTVSFLKKPRLFQKKDVRGLGTGSVSGCSSFPCSPDMKDSKLINSYFIQSAAVNICSVIPKPHLKKAQGHGLHQTQTRRLLEVVDPL